jgi:hypothetical protein
MPLMQELVFDADMKLVFTADGKGVTLHQRGGQFVGKRR